MVTVEGGTKPWSIPQVLASTTFVIGATAAQLYRSNTRPWHAWWAEDGAVFYPDAMRYSLFTTLHLVYNGYLQTVSRPLAEIATWVKPSHAPLVLATTTDLAISLLAVYVWRASRSAFRHSWGPLLLAGLMVAIPQAGFETVSSLADLHWYLDFAALWAVWRPLDRRSTVLSSGALCLLAVLSDPLAGLLLFPAVVGVIVAAPERRRRLAVIACFLAGGIIQGIATINSHPYRVPLSFGAISRFFIVRITEAIVVGERLMPGFYHRTGYEAGIALTAAGGVIILLGLRLIGLRASLAPVVCVALAVAFTVVCLRFRGSITIPKRFFTYDGSRYTLVPALLLWAAVLLIVDHLSPLPAAGSIARVRGHRALLGAGLALMVISVAVNWRTPNVRDGAPSWRAQLAVADRRCRLPPADRPAPIPTIVRDINAPRPDAGPGEVTFYIAPMVGRVHDFSIVVACNRL